MKYILILLCCATSFYVYADPLTKSDLAVKWKPQSEKFKSISSFIEYKTDGEVIFSHGPSGESIYRSKVLKEVDDLYIFHFYNPDNTLRFKFVASGWKTENWETEVYTKMLFGMLYEYDVIGGETQVVNGFPLHYIYQRNQQAHR